MASDLDDEEIMCDEWRIPRPKTLLPSNLHPPPSTIAFNMHIQGIVDGGGCRFDGSSVLGRGVRRDDMQSCHMMTCCM